jgi:biotin synthase
MQALGLYVANSIFIGDYLTTKGQAPDADYRMIAEMGFTVTQDPLINTSNGSCSSC